MHLSDSSGEGIEFVHVISVPPFDKAVILQQLRLHTALVNYILYTVLYNCIQTTSTWVMLYTRRWRSRSRRNIAAAEALHVVRLSLLGLGP